MSEGRVDSSASGPWALVTGGASGIGRGIAAALLEADYGVIIGDIRADHLLDAQRLFARYEKRVRVCRLDVASREDWQAARAQVEVLGGALHVLCLNAGIGVLGTLMQSCSADWEWLMNVNLRGVTLGLEAMLPLVLAAGAGARVCATSSMGGLLVADDGGIYSCAKFGVVALMECLRADLRERGIGVTVLCPAAVNTHIYDHARMRPPEYMQSGLLLDEEKQRRSEQMARSFLSRGADPFAVGVRVVNALRRDDAYVFTDSLVEPMLQARREALLGARRLNP